MQREGWQEHVSLHQDIVPLRGLTLQTQQLLRAPHVLRIEGKMATSIRAVILEHEQPCPGHIIHEDGAASQPWKVGECAVDHACEIGESGRAYNHEGCVSFLRRHLQKFVIEQFVIDLRAPTFEACIVNENSISTGWVTSLRNDLRCLGRLRWRGHWK